MVYASFQHLYVMADTHISAITMTTAMWPYMTTCLARITPRLLFFPSTTMVSPSCSFGTTAGETPSPVCLITVVLLSIHTATGCAPPVLCFVALPATM